MTTGDTRAEARAILAGAAPGVVDRPVLWAVGAFYAWHAATLVQAWGRGLLVDSESSGGTLGDRGQWRSITADRRKAVIVDCDDREALAIRLADVVPLVDPQHLPAALVDNVRAVVGEHYAAGAVQMAATSAHVLGQHFETSAERETRQAQSAAIERRCEQLADHASAHVRPPAALFDLIAAG